MNSYLNHARKMIIQSYYFLPYRVDRDNSKVPIGGGRRYLRDLGHFFFEQGFEITYIQKGNKNEIVTFEDWAKVRYIASPNGSKGDFIFAKRAYKIIKKGDPDLICYGNMEDCFPYVHSKSFAIQHGIWWDCPMPLWKRKYQELRVRYVSKRVSLVICVDTNFINWYRIKWPNSRKVLKKFYFVPNYADLENFQPPSVPIDDPPTLLFPRRFEIKRGYKLFAEMCECLNSMGFNFRAIFLGDGPDRKQIEEFILSKHNNYANISTASLDSISKYYRQSFLTFIPTLWSEGTSLSAIESICSGCPVIASDVGGLGNVVIPGFSGEICPPDVGSFVKVTAEFLRDPKLRAQMSKNCLSMRDTFSKKRWERKLKELVFSKVLK